MMPNNNEDAVLKLQQRVKKLAAEKSYLQLILQLISKINTVSGLENTIDNLLHAVMDVIGGANLILALYGFLGLFNQSFQKGR
jgi:hypothetical protein